MHALIVTRRPEAFSAFAQALAEGTGLDLRYTETWSNALAMARDLPPALAVLDEGLEHGAPLDLARRLLQVNAFIDLAVVSGLDAEAFHEASEGLGILSPVPTSPAAEDGAALARLLRGLGRELPIQARQL